MSDLADETVSAIRRVVYGEIGITKSSDSGAMLEAVLEGAVRPQADRIDMYAKHFAYVDMMLKAMNEPPGAMMPGPGPGRRQEPYEPDEWQMMRVRNGAA